MSRKKKEAEEVEAEEVQANPEQEEADLIHFVNASESVTWCGIDINAHKGPVQFESQTDKADNVTCDKCRGGVI